ncbi:long-chain-fatty-acid--CoA ligase [Zhongshania sp.]|uniref:long-chain-fatty-acid--CoA ligase n=1 Tax=Zhongshania sp. TaxID=1971902 RepID=UPI0035628C5E
MNTTESIIRNALRCPNSSAIIENEINFSWQELSGRVGRLAGALQTCGIGFGDHVAQLLGNAYRNIESTYAVQWLGAAVVPINIRWTAAEVAFALEDCEAKLLFVDRQNLATYQNLPLALTEAITVIWADSGDCPDGMLSYDSLITTSSAAARAEVSGTDISSIFYTGGTTGRSKGVMLSHDNQVAHSIAFIADCGLAAGGKYLHAAPMFHIADSLFTHVVSMLGGVHVILPQFSPQGLAEIVSKHQVEFTVLVPTMIQMVMSDRAVADRVFKVLKHLYYGASPMPEALTREILSAYPDLDLSQAYGQTESSPVLTILPPRWHGKGEPLPQARSAGRPIYGTELRIVDSEDRELAIGETGEIVARGPQVMQGYWKRPEETAAALRGGWLHTGDAGVMDELGFVYVVDRIKDMIISGGENVYTVEVENAIYDIPGVAQCSVIGLPHEKWGEAVHAIVVPAAGVDLEEATILNHCREQLADFKRPRSVTIRREPLPISGAGKILKRELRAEMIA